MQRDTLTGMRPYNLDQFEDIYFCAVTPAACVTGIFIGAGSVLCSRQQIGEGTIFAKAMITGILGGGLLGGFIFISGVAVVLAKYLSGPDNFDRPKKVGRQNPPLGQPPL